MRVLLLAPHVPWPPRQGTAIRNYHVARELARRHEVTLLAFAADAGGDGQLERDGVRVVSVPPPPPRTTTRRTVDLVLDPVPDLARRMGSRPMGDALGRLLAGIADAPSVDVVQVEGLEMALHAFAALDAAGHAPPLVYDAHNAEWLLQDRVWRTDARRIGAWHGALYSRAQTAKLRRFERRLIRRSAAVIAVSRSDAAALRAIAPDAPVTVVPNGVDTERYEVADPDASEPGLCVFVGKMDFRPNVDAMAWFCARVWPIVRAARPGARLEIVGRDPTRRVLELGAPDVLVTGAVDDVRPYLSRASVVVAPLRAGGGTRLKVLEAMAAGRPVAATAMAVDGLDLRAGEELLVASSERDLAAAVIRLVDDGDLRRRLAAAARARVEADYRWSTLVPRIEDVHAKVGSRAPA